MTTYADVIRAAMPDASQDECEWVLWERTPYPMGHVTARSLFKAASRFGRATASGIRLCELCNNRAEDKWTCGACQRALAACRDHDAPAGGAAGERG